MSLNRYAKKRDLSEPEIISALEKAGFKVWNYLPVDLLTWRIDKGFRPLECKTPYGKESPKARLDKRQKAQIEFLQVTGCPLVLTPEQALRALGVA